MTQKIQKSQDSMLQLEKELGLLAEAMAKNVHDHWVQKRIADGWSYGKKRDDDKKCHPCLVPYEKLPESEKEYDRTTAMETLKFILDHGFEIRKKSKKK